MLLSWSHLNKWGKVPATGHRAYVERAVESCLLAVAVIALTANSGFAAPITFDQDLPATRGRSRDVEPSARLSSGFGERQSSGLVTGVPNVTGNLSLIFPQLGTRTFPLFMPVYAMVSGPAAFNLPSSIVAGSATFTNIPTSIPNINEVRLAPFANMQFQGFPSFTCSAPGPNVSCPPAARGLTGALAGDVGLSAFGGLVSLSWLQNVVGGGGTATVTVLTLTARLSGAHWVTGPVFVFANGTTYVMTGSAGPSSLSYVSPAVIRSNFSSDIPFFARLNLNFHYPGTPTSTPTSTPTVTPTVLAPGCPATAGEGGCTAGFEKAFLLVKEDVPGKEKLIAKMIKGPALAQTDLGNPLVVNGTAYSLCIYDEPGNLVSDLIIDNAGQTCDGKECWKPVGKDPPDGKGYKYKDKSLAEDGILKLLYKGGDAGKSKVIVKGKGANLPDGIPAALLASNSATIQLHSNNASCLSASVSDIKKHEASFFKAK